MTFRGLVMKFRLGSGEQLKALCTKCGYSKPESKDNIIVRKVLPGPHGSIEVHKKDDETVMVLIKPDPESPETDTFIGVAITQALNDLEAVGLYNDIPF